MATKKPDPNEKPPPKTPPKKGDGAVKTQMKGGESGNDDLGYDPAIIPTETIEDD